MAPLHTWAGCGRRDQGRGRFPAIWNDVFAGSARLDAPSGRGCWTPQLDIMANLPHFQGPCLYFLGGAYSLPSAAAENGAPAKGVPGAPKRDRAPRPRLRSVGSERPPFPTSWQRPRANSSGWWRARRLAAVARETEGPGATASEPVVARVAKRDRAFKGGSFARRRSRRKGASQAGEEGGAERSAAAAGSR